jgi:hypothetical protein
MFVHESARLDAVRSYSAIIGALGLGITAVWKADGTAVRRHKDIFLLEAKPKLGFALSLDEIASVGIMWPPVTMEYFTQNEIGIRFERVGINADWLKYAI